MRVAFVDHSFHQKTQSSRFFLELISAHWTVDVILDHSWDRGTRRPPPAPFEPEDYDIVIIYQAHEFFERLKHGHRNLVFVPMYDAMIWAGQFYWRDSFNQSKVISFSWKLHEEVMRRNRWSSHFQYFPDPSGMAPVVPDDDGIRGFFWYRTEAIGPQTVFDLCRGQTLETLTIHNAPDPHQPGIASWSCPADIRHLERSGWFESEHDYREMLRRHSVFFAPRMLEGIGMSVLEAMALGQCVVAPDAPTMNEYISNGTNGLLYPPERPGAVDLSRHRDLGARARDSIERGFVRWQASLPNLLDFIAAPRETLGRTVTGWVRGGPKPEPLPQLPIPLPPPRVSVVTVCLNAATVLEQTMLSVLAQSGIALEFLVLDGGSTDGSLGIIGKYADRLAWWHSAPDDGIYPAMNLALERTRGDWVMFMNAGDGFVSADALARMFAAVPAEAGVVYGHHLYRQEDGSDGYRRAVDFEVTWQRLQTGALGYDWVAGIPAHQATAVRRDLLQRLRFDTRYRLAADHDLLFRARREQVRFFNCDELIAVYDGGGRSLGNFRRCHQEWAAIARSHGDPRGADRFGREMAIHDSVLVGTLRRLFRSRIDGLQRRHPVLAARLRGLIRRALALAAAGRGLVRRHP
jgi:glycosyltransferase involved in cell wall biosynthesis